MSIIHWGLEATADTTAYWWRLQRPLETAVISSRWYWHPGTLNTTETSQWRLVETADTTGGCWCGLQTPLEDAGVDYRHLWKLQRPVETWNCRLASFPGHSRILSLDMPLEAGRNCRYHWRLVETAETFGSWWKLQRPLEAGGNCRDHWRLVETAETDTTGRRLVYRLHTPLENVETSRNWWKLQIPLETGVQSGADIRDHWIPWRLQRAVKTGGDCRDHWRLVKIAVTSGDCWNSTETSGDHRDHQEHWTLTAERLCAQV